MFFLSAKYLLAILEHLARTSPHLGVRYMAFYFLVKQNHVKKNQDLTGLFWETMDQVFASAGTPDGLRLHSSPIFDQYCQYHPYSMLFLDKDVKKRVRCVEVLYTLCCVTVCTHSFIATRILCLLPSASLNLNRRQRGLVRGC